MVSTKHEHFQRVRQDHQGEVLEDYVEEIAFLHQQHGEARASELAQRLGVSAAAVSKTIARLKAEGYVAARPYRGIFLTERGEEMARWVAARHQTVLKTLLKLGVPEHIARPDAEGIEHHCSEETVLAMQAFLTQHSHLAD